MALFRASKKFVKVCASLVGWASAATVFNENFYSVALCQGESMMPTIRDGDIFIMKSLVADPRSVKGNDIVVAVCPEQPGRYICKRVTALEGWPAPVPLENHAEVRKGHVWLEGDNKQCSYDSRDYGDIPCGLIKGRVLYRVWPWKNRGYIK